jgi:hypothetical protein
MPVENLSFAAPFFTVHLLTNVTTYDLDTRAIALNLGKRALSIEQQSLAPLTSVIVQDCKLSDVERCLLIEGFDDHNDDDALFEEIKTQWPSAFDVRREERLRGVSHYMSPKTIKGDLGLTMYHSGSVPLNVGLHQDHPFCPVPGFREVHTQIVGFGKMQQCREKDVGTLYLEEPMAPGATHRPMYDANGNYPWHQYETITPSVFLAVELLPKGASFPDQEM